MKRRLVLMMLVCVAMIATVRAQDATPEPTAEATAEAATALPPAPDQIIIAEPNLFPEGLEYYADEDVFLVSSVQIGTIHSVALDGTLTPFIEDERIGASVGLEVDAERGRLLVAVNGANNQNPAVAAYDLDTREPIFFTELAALEAGNRYFANDITIDADGNAYVTDSYAGAIYRVDMDGNAEIWLQDAAFSGSFTLNGLVYHPDGYIIAVRQPFLMKIPLDAPQDYANITISDSLVGGDGLYLLEDGRLVVVSNGLNRVYLFASDDDFVSATAEGMFRAARAFTTTATVRGDEVFVLYAYLNQSRKDQFEITKVVFAAP
jgi:sugar lactone lactonase YvrE